MKPVAEKMNKPAKRKRVKLTKLAVERCQPEETKWIAWDSEITGFGVAVHPTGKKTYLIDYYNAARHRHRLTIGVHGRITCEEARVQARKSLGQIANGNDPMDKRPNRQDMTVEQFWNGEYKANHFARLKSKSQEAYESLWRVHIKPEIGHLRPKQVTRVHALNIFNRMHNTPQQANSVMAYMATLFRLMANAEPPLFEGKLPTAGVDLHPIRRRTNPFTAEKLMRLNEAMNSEKWQETRRRRMFVTGIKLLLLTGCRRREIFEVPRAGLDLEARTLLIPNHKTSRRKIVETNDGGIDQPKKIRLSLQATAVLRKIEPEWADRPENTFLIQDGIGGFEGAWEAWKALCKDAEIENCRLHDLRHCYGSRGLSSAKVNMDQMQALLHHQNPASTRIYAKLDDRAEREAADLMGDIMGELIDA